MLWISYPLPAEMSQRDVPGFAIGGLSGGEEKDDFWRMVTLSTDHLPREKPRYLMGVGYVCLKQQPVTLIISYLFSNLCTLHHCSIVLLFTSFIVVVFKTDIIECV